MKKFIKLLQKIENVIMIITFTIMVFSFFAQVVNRNIIKSSVAWFEEASVFCMIYMVLIGTEVGLRDGSQLAVTAITDKLHGKFKKIIEIIAKIVVIAFSAAVFCTAITLVRRQIASGQLSPALELPMSIPSAALVISFGIITLVQTMSVLVMIGDLGKKEEVVAK